MLNTPFSPWPSYTDEEVLAASQVLRSNRVNYWTGNECREFETEFATLAQADYAVALANGTLALDAVWPALGIGPGDEVIVTPRSFMASASTIVMAGATPIFADVDPDSQNITAETVAPLISARTRAILCVHLAGWPCEMNEMRNLAAARNIALVEDCAQAHGARYNNRSVGDLGDIAAWSFCQDKIMTTGGEGGMVTTSNEEYWSSIWSLKDHGKSYEAVYKREHRPGFRWVHESFGSNWRMTEIQAAIGRLQIKRLPEWHAKRTENAKTIAAAWGDLDALRIPMPPSHIQHAWYKFYAFVRPDMLKSGWDRDRLVAEINTQGVPCYMGSCSEIYLEKAFTDRNIGPPARLPVARALGETSMMFLVHPTLSADEIAKTCTVVRQVVQQAKR